MNLIKSTIIAFALSTGVAVAAENPMVGGAAMYADKNIVENAVNSADHTTLVAAVQAAGLAETLQGEGPFMVFAPTNEAFEMLPPGTVEMLLKPENKDKLTAILLYHVVSANALSDAIKKMVRDDGGAHPVKTVGGEQLMVRTESGNIYLYDTSGGIAKVTIADVRQSNGVIHVVNRVLIPR
ncbi:MAG: fasciclin domain-containing protein [Paracoccaceae bacterium]